MIVCIGHMASLLFPSIYFGPAYMSHTEFAKWIYETPFNFFFNAPSALMCFFLLSGFVIPLKKFLSGENISVLGKWGERWLRFMPMALIGTCLGWLVMKLGLVYSLNIADMAYSYEYGRSWYNFIPDDFFASEGPVFDGIIRTFIKNSKYDGPLGTLKYIWLNSFILLGFTKWITDFKYRDIIYFVSIAMGYFGGVFVKYEYFYFGAMVIGFWICDGFYNPKRTIKWNSLGKKKSIVIFIGALIFLSIPYGTPTHGIYSFVKNIPFQRYLFWAIGWGMLVIAIENINSIKVLLEGKCLQKIGDISFSLFAVHWPLVVSITCYITYILTSKWEIVYVLSGTVAMLLSFVVILVVSYWIENVLYKYLYRFEKYIVGKLVEK